MKIINVMDKQTLSNETDYFLHAEFEQDMYFPSIEVATKGKEIVKINLLESGYVSSDYILTCEEKLQVIKFMDDYLRSIE